MSDDSCSQGRFASKKRAADFIVPCRYSKYVQRIQATEEKKKEIGIYSHMAHPPVHCLVFSFEPCLLISIDKRMTKKISSTAFLKNENARIGESKSSTPEATC
jgi:hypothetical protein